MSGENPQIPGEHSGESKNAFFHVSDIARQLGHNVLQKIDAVVPRSLTEPKLTPVEELVRDQNELMDIRKNAHLSANLFRHRPDLDPDIQTSLMQAYKTELMTRHTPMDRYALFMDERFMDHVYTLDLAETKQAGSHEEIARLKSEYLELRDRLVMRNTINGELKRDETTTQFHFSDMNHQLYASGVRNRKLFCFERDGRKITVAKRMDFLILRTEISDAELSVPEIKAETVRKVQELIDTEDEAIVPVRTVYYASNKEKKF